MSVEEKLGNSGSNKPLGEGKNEQNIAHFSQNELAYLTTSSDLNKLKEETVRLYEKKIKALKKSGDLKSAQKLESRQAKLESVKKEYINSDDTEVSQGAKDAFGQVMQETLQEMGGIDAEFKSAVKSLFEKLGLHAYAATLEQIFQFEGEGEAITPFGVFMQDLPKNDRKLLKQAMKGKFGDLYDGEMTRERMPRDQQKELVRLIRIVEDVNLSSFFDLFGPSQLIAYAGKTENELKAIWSKEGELGKEYKNHTRAQLRGVESRRLAQLSRLMIDLSKSNDTSVVKDFLSHLQAASNISNIDAAKKKGTAYHQQLEYFKGHAAREEVGENPVYINALDGLFANNDYDASVEEGIAADDQRQYGATKSWIYQALHLKQRKDIVKQNKEIRKENKDIKKTRKETSIAQKEAGANVLFEGQIKNSLDVARKLLGENADTTIMKHILGFLETHYTSLTKNEVVLKGSLIDAIKANKNSDIQAIIDNVFIAHPESFVYVRQFLKMNPHQAVNVFAYGSAYAEKDLETTESTASDSKESAAGVTKIVSEKINLAADDLQKQIDAETDPAKKAELQQAKTALDSLGAPARQQLAEDMLVLVGSIVKYAEGAGLAHIHALDLQNKIFQSLQLSVGAFQGVGKRSLAGSNLSLGVSFTGSQKTGEKGTLFYGIGGGGSGHLSAIGFVPGRDAAAILGHTWKINEKHLQTLGPVSAKSLSLAAAASVRSGVGVYAGWNQDKLEGISTAEKHLLTQLQTAITAALATHKTDKSKSLEQLIGEELTKSYPKDNAEIRSNLARNIAMNLLSYTESAEFVSATPAQTADLAKQLSEQYVSFRRSSKVDDLGVGAKSTHLANITAGLQFLGKGILPLFALGGALSRYKHPRRAEDDASRKHAEALKALGGGVERTQSFGEAIELYNTLLDVPAGSLPLDARLEIKDGKVFVPFTLIDFLHTHHGGLMLEDIMHAYIQQDDTGIYVPVETNSSLVVVPNAKDVEYALHIGNALDVASSKSKITTKEMLSAVKTDTTGIDAYTKALDAVKLKESINSAKMKEIYSKFFADINKTAPIFSPTEMSLAITDIVDGIPVGKISLPIASGERVRIISPLLSVSEGVLQIPLYGTLLIKKITTDGVSTREVGFGAGQIAEDQKIKVIFESTTTYTPETKQLGGAVFDLADVQPALDAFLHERTGVAKILDWRYADAKRTPNKDHKGFYDALKTENYAAATTIARKYMPQEIILDESAVGKANLHTLRAELSRVDMTEYKDSPTFSEAKALITEMKTISESQQMNLLTLATAILDTENHVETFKYHQHALESILGIKYGVDSYNRDKLRTDPAYKLAYLLAPASVIDRTRTNKLQARLKNEPQFKNPATLQRFMQTRETIFENMDTANVMGNSGNKMENHVGLVFGYGDGQIDEKFLSHPEAMNFEGGIIEYDRQKNANEISYFVDNVPDSYLMADKESIIAHLEKQKDTVGLTQSSKNKLDDMITLFGNIKADEMRTLWKNGTFPGLPKEMTIAKQFAQAKYTKCINDMIIAGPTTISLQLEIQQQAPVEPSVEKQTEISLKKRGIARVATTAIGHELLKDKKGVGVGLVAGDPTKPEKEITGKGITTPEIGAELDKEAIQKILGDLSDKKTIPNDMIQKIQDRWNALPIRERAQVNGFFTKLYNTPNRFNTHAHEFSVFMSNFIGQSLDITSFLKQFYKISGTLSPKLPALSTFVDPTLSTLNNLAQIIKRQHDLSTKK